MINVYDGANHHQSCRIYNVFEDRGSGINSGQSQLGCIVRVVLQFEQILCVLLVVTFAESFEIVPQCFLDLAVFYRYTV